MTTPAVLGFDIGGSKTQAVRVENGIVTAEALAGSANISSVGIEEAGRQLDVILDRLGANGIRAVCAGAAGVETPAAEARLRDLLAVRLPCARVRVVHDSQLILAAAGVMDGIALISGTGSVAWGRRGDRQTRTGGWGYLLGDEGSGYWVAREAVRRSLTRVDHGEPADRLGQQLAADCGLQFPASCSTTSTPSPTGATGRAGPAWCSNWPATATWSAARSSTKRAPPWPAWRSRSETGWDRKVRWC
ncbi:BadF/BadG/BcrA/BcrD type ATPase [Mycolicibacterium mageritense DSM 44476 = CIP 104973]|uniref:ATPase BadF/BadG/BcrA/BcrD type domain-containing protein n=1 Tax=Mycolicibacterium mageritense TaxID=53462 RepID=A0ABN5YAW9_MYCME|nr:hypothetical protein MMAGJ_45860 [Mycolicibacterium mageritense]CDO20186.1 BadF/BadG/BcrA/BcrD type ATPase [Mycolicibacterium mageritense DSM 44476 = CIP 104973]